MYFTNSHCYSVLRCENITQLIIHSVLFVCAFCLFFCAASDKQTLLNNDQLYQVSDYEMKETLLVSGGKILKWGSGGQVIWKLLCTQKPLRT